MAFWRKQNESKESRHEEKKTGLIRRLWQKLRNIDWSNPINRWKLLFAGLVFFIVLLGGSYGAIKATSTPSFCNVCHEMAPENVTYNASSHSEIACTNCHIGPGAVNTVVHKVEALKEVYYHIVGPPNPIAQTKAVPNKNCQACHSSNRSVTANGDLIVEHGKHIDEEIPCVTCHSGVAHAKVVERGLNTQKDMDKWTPEVADKIMGKQYMAPNMGTCIDCHNQVNEGKKPWEDISYSLPENTHGKESDKKEEKSSGDHEVEAAELSAEDADKDSHKKTQDSIIKAISTQSPDAKISMECSTCHKKIDTPADHDTQEWNQNHGGTALETFDQCMKCHMDAKWIKVLPKQDIDQLLKAEKKLPYAKDINVVKTDARQNQFCNACHADRPPGHEESDTWLTGHAKTAKTSEEKANCLVCHDQEKPKDGLKTNAPTDVYCEFCHRTGFKGDI